VGEMIQPPALTNKKTARPAAQVFNLQAIGASIGNIELNGTGSMASAPAAEPAKFQLALKSNTFSLQDLSKLVPPAAAYKLNGSAQLDLKASGTAAAPQAHGSLTLQNASLHYEQSDLTGISTAMTFTQQDVSIPKLTGKLNGSDIALTLTGHRMDTHPDLNVEASVTELDLNKLLAAPAAPPAAFRQTGMAGTAWAAPAPAASTPMDVNGHITVGRIKHEFYNAQNLDFKCDLKNVTPDLGQIAGTADLKQGPGKLEELEKLVSTSKGARIALMPLNILQKLDKRGVLHSIGLPPLDTIPFNNIVGNYVLHSGMMDIKAFDLNGSDISINTLGTVGLAGDQLLNMVVTTHVRPGIVRGTVGKIFSDETGRITLAFSVKGTMANPDVKPDLSKSAQKAVGQILKGFGMGGNKQEAPPAAPAPGNGTAGSPAPPPPPAPPDPAKEIEKALKKFKIFK
jgi:autotransporter translocation and assembly factor TamB